MRLGEKESKTKRERESEIEGEEVLTCKLEPGVSDLFPGMIDSRV